MKEEWRWLWENKSRLGMLMVDGKEVLAKLSEEFEDKSKKVFSITREDLDALFGYLQYIDQFGTKDIKNIPDFYKELLSMEITDDPNSENYTVEYDFSDKCKTLFKGESCGKWVVFNKEDMTNALETKEIFKLDKLVKRIWESGKKRLN